MTAMLIPLIIAAAFFCAGLNLYGLSGADHLTHGKAILRILTAATLAFVGTIYAFLYADVFTFNSHWPVFLRSGLLALVILAGADALADRHRS